VCQPYKSGWPRAFISRGLNSTRKDSAFSHFLLCAGAAMENHFSGFGIDGRLTIQQSRKMHFGAHHVGVAVLNLLHLRKIEHPAVFQFKKNGVV
jgi:hypothetical protein